MMIKVYICGAELHTINALQFKKDYPKLEQISLIENYRSTQDILDLSYNFIQLNNPERLGKLKTNQVSYLKN